MENSEDISQGSDAAVTSEPAVNSSWYGQVADDAVGYIENKGWKQASDVIEGYRNLEKMFGADRADRTITIPKEGEAWDGVYSKLGRPESSDKYEFKSEYSGDETVSWFKDQAFAAGLNQSQAAALLDNWMEYSGNISESRSKDQELKHDSEMADLKKDWGNAYDANMQSAKRAASEFGFSQDELDSIEGAIGPKALLDKLSNIGKALSEDSYQASSREANFIISPAEAQERISNLKLDKTFMDQYMSGSPEAMEKMTKLMNAAYPEG